jgi:hypothetical protein
VRESGIIRWLSDAASKTMEEQRNRARRRKTAKPEVIRLFSWLDGAIPDDTFGAAQ